MTARATMRQRPTAYHSVSNIERPKHGGSIADSGNCVFRCHSDTTDAPLRAMLRALAEGQELMEFQCYYCGGNAYRRLRKQPHTVECLKCGRSSKFGGPDDPGFVCPRCGTRSFMVVPGSHPMQVECLKCGTVAPFYAEDDDSPAQPTKGGN